MTVWGVFGRVFVAAALLAVTACNGGEDTEPRALPSLSGSAEATPSATASMTVEQEVEAAVRAYFDAVNRANATGDTAELERLALPSCGCRTLREFIEKEWSKGQVSGGLTTITDIAVHDVDLPRVGAKVTWTATASRTTAANGTVVSEYGDGRAVDDFLLVRGSDGTWRVAQVVNLEKA